MSYSIYCCEKKRYNLVDNTILQNERLKLLIDSYIHITINEYIEDGIINIIEKYISNDFKILSLKEQKLINKQERIDKFEQKIRKMTRFLQNFIPYLLRIYGIQPLMNIVFIIIGIFSINEPDCNGFPMNPAMYLLIGSSSIVGSFIFKCFSIVGIGITDKCGWINIALSILILMALVSIIEHLFTLIWIIIGIIMRLDNRYQCNIPAISVYIVMECLLLIPSLMLHSLLIGVMFINNNND